MSCCVTYSVRRSGTSSVPFTKCRASSTMMKAEMAICSSRPDCTYEAWIARKPGCQPCCRSTLRGLSRDLDPRVFRMWPCPESVAPSGAHLALECGLSRLASGRRAARSKEVPDRPHGRLYKGPLRSYRSSATNHPEFPVQRNVRSSTH